MEFTCATCGFRDPRQLVCLLLQRQINPQGRACQWRDPSPMHCEACRRITVGPIITNEDGQPHIYCANCVQTLS